MTPSSDAAPEANSSPLAPKAQFTELLESFQRRLDDELLSAVAERRRVLEEEAPEATELSDALESLLRAGGKRVRPALVWFTHKACGGDQDQVALGMGAACELLHAYLLVHDDIMDHSEVRRGCPAAHVRFRDLHAQKNWQGDAEDYGHASAILVGDLAYAWSQAAFSTAIGAIDHSKAAHLHRAFAGMTEEVIAGQHLEMRVAARGEATEDQLARVLRLKSGRYTVERPVQLGALLAGAPAAVQSSLSDYGSALGEAFQLRDDLLGVFGDASEVGKPVGGDLVEGKMTFLIFHALKMLTPESGALLRERLNRGELSAEEITESCSMIEACGARDAVRTMISERLSAAQKSLAKIADALNPEGHAFLEGMASYLAERSR